VDLTALRSLTRNLAFERSGDEGLVTPTELDEIINLAQRNLYVHISSLWPAVFAERSTEVFFNATAIQSVLFASLVTTGNEPMKVTGVEVGAAGGMTTKRVIPVLDRPEDAIVLQERGITYPVYPAAWWVEGRTVRFTKATSTDVNIIATIIRYPSELVLITDKPWGDKLQHHHDKIAILSANLIHLKDEKGDTPWSQLFSSFDEILVADLGRPTTREGDKK